MIALVFHDADQRLARGAIRDVGQRRGGELGVVVLEERAVDERLGGDLLERLAQVAGQRRVGGEELGHRLNTEIFSGVRRGEREAALRVIDLLDRRLVRAPDEIGGGAERHQLPRHAAEGRDARVLFACIMQP